MPDRRLDVKRHVDLRETLIEQFPTLLDDGDALRDTLEGVSALPDQCLAVLRWGAEQEAHAEALGALIKQMQSRKARLDMAAQRARDAVFRAMQAAELPRIVAPDMTVSIGKGRPKVIIIDAAEVPTNCCRLVYEPDKTKIAELIKRGQPVPGATLSNPTPVLTIRRS